MTDDGMVRTVDRAAEVGRQGFYDRAREEHLAPLWQVLHGLVPEEPKPTEVPAHFAYDRVRPYLLEACELIGTEEAERRVMVMENPALQGRSRITTNLFAGFQIILPGEIAPAHRHVATALRFIVEGRNGYTSVGGERTTMEPGDFVITPSMGWHDHGNESDGPMVWLDGLDMHIVNFFNASFREGYPGAVHPTSRPEGSAMGEVGMNLLPEGFEHASQSSPIFNYPYRQSREALARMTRLGDPDPHHGYRMNYINPLNGGAAIPTMTTALRLVPRGFGTEPYRSTAGTVGIVVEGQGVARIGGDVFDLRPHDLFVVPSWCRFELEGRDDLVVFTYSDQVVQEKLDIFREQRGGD